MKQYTINIPMPQYGADVCTEIVIPEVVANEIKADVIDECIAKINREHTHSAYNDDVYEAIMLLEQMKEGAEC